MKLGADLVVGATIQVAGGDDVVAHLADRLEHEELGRHAAARALQRSYTSRPVSQQALNTT